MAKKTATTDTATTTATDTEVTTGTETAMTTTETPGALAKSNMDYSDYEGEGYEDQTPEDMSLPFVILLQGGTPAVKDKLVEGAEAGLFMNTMTKELFEELLIVPSKTTHTYIQFVPRDAGGGYVANHEIESPIVARAKKESTQFGKYHTPHMDEEGNEVKTKRFKGDEGDDLQETYTVFGIQLDADMKPIGAVIVPFKSTAIKAYKNMNSTCRRQQVDDPNVKGRRINVPLFGNIAKFKSVIGKNKKTGDSYYMPEYVPAINGNPRESLIGIDDQRFQEAEQFHKFLKQGLAKIDYSKQQDAEGNVGAEGRGEKAPF